MLLSMAFPNILGGMLLAPVVRKHVKAYKAKLAAGDFDSPTPSAETDNA